MADSYLNKSGLSYFWDKIKAALQEKVNSKRSYTTATTVSYKKITVIGGDYSTDGTGIILFTREERYIIDGMCASGYGGNLFELGTNHNANNTSATTSNRWVNVKVYGVPDSRTTEIYCRMSPYTYVDVHSSGTITIANSTETEWTNATNNASYKSLTTPTTLQLGAGASGSVSFAGNNGTVTLPVTDVKDAYVTWGGKPLYSTVSPDDAGCIDEFGHNKMAFLPANCIQVHYSTDGGSTWVDYGLTDAQKIQLVTYGDVFCRTGGTTAATSSNVTNLKLRIRIATAASTTTTGVGSLYTDWRKVLLNVNDPNSNCNMTMRYRTIGNYKSGTETWVDSGTTYPVRGGTAWNSIPRPSGWPAFGGNYANQTSQIGQLEFVLSNTALGTWGDKKGSICSIRMIGMSNWATPSEMARTGRLYSIDAASKNATFPASIYAGSDISAYNIYYRGGSNYGHIGSSTTPFKDLYLKDAIYADGNRLDLPDSAGTIALTSDVPSKISDLSNTSGGFVTYCTCTTAAGTAAKVVTIDSGDTNWVLRKGSIIAVKFTNTNTASNVTLNVNNTGAKSVYYNTSVNTGNSNSIFGYANRVVFYLYDGTNWVWISDSRHDGNDNTYTTAYCSTAAGTAAKTASMTGYVLTANRYTVLTITNANTAASALTLNINGKGAKPLYINGTASSSTNHTLPAGSYIVWYDGTNYYIYNNGEIPRMIHSEEPVSVTPPSTSVSGSEITDGSITYAKTATGEFLKLQLSTVDIGEGVSLPPNTLYGVYE